MTKEEAITLLCEHFSEGMVRTIVDALIKDEREECAEIAEKQRYAMHISLTSHPAQNGTAVGLANQIRARGQA